MSTLFNRTSVFLNRASSFLNRASVFLNRASACFNRAPLFLTRTSRVFHRTSVLLLVPAGLLLLAGGCHAPKKEGKVEMTGPIRALWVTRFDYETPQDVIRIMDNCRDGGFNTVLFQVRGNGTVSYSSRIEPWAKQFNHRDPGFDPLALAVHEAHARDLKLHAWVNVIPAWMGPGEPPIRNQLYYTHPQWFWYDAQGRRQPIHHEVAGRVRDWYVSLNPCLPEVRRYLVGVFRELVSNYDVDGLHMDYIRFPNEPVVAGETIPDYPRDERTLALFKEATGQTPESDAQGWSQWRTDQVTRLVSDIHEMVRGTKPGVALSAAVGAVRKNALKHFQDARAWMDEGLVDAVFLMNYTSDPDKFAQRLEPWLGPAGDVRVVPGLSISDRPDTVKGAETAWHEIEIARQATGHFCIFAYSKLFDSVNTEFDKQSETEARKRAERRQVLLPRLRALAEEQVACSLPVR